jgi:hypothetical protein
MVEANRGLNESIGAIAFICIALRSFYLDSVDLKQQLSQKILTLDPPTP